MPFLIFNEPDDDRDALNTLEVALRRIHEANIDGHYVLYVEDTTRADLKRVLKGTDALILDTREIEPDEK